MGDDFKTGYIKVQSYVNIIGGFFPAKKQQGPNHHQFSVVDLENEKKKETNLSIAPPMANKIHFSLIPSPSSSEKELCIILEHFCNLWLPNRFLFGKRQQTSNNGIQKKAII